MEFKIKLIFAIAILASGCVGQSSSTLERITANPGEYVGEEVTLTGQIEVKKHDGFLNREVAESTVSEEVIQVKTAERNIGDLGGQLPIIGECRQSDYASEVKVKGEIKSYSQCNCNVARRTVYYGGNTTIILNHEDKGIIKTSDRSLYQEMAGYPSGDSELLDITGNDLYEINETMNENLIDVLNLNNLEDDQVIPEGNYWSNGSLDTDDYVSGAGRLVSREYKYSLTEDSIIIQRDSVEEDSFKTNTPSAICKNQDEVRVPVNYNSHREIEYKGCNTPEEEKYYFSCQKVVEQIE